MGFATWPSLIQDRNRSGGKASSGTEIKFRLGRECPDINLIATGSAVDQGVLRAAVLTPLTMDTALEMLVQAMKEGSQPQEKTFVEAHSYPSLEELAKRRNGART
jgi:hypothetical protein